MNSSLYAIIFVAVSGTGLAGLWWIRRRFARGRGEKYHFPTWRELLTVRAEPLVQVGAPVNWRERLVEWGIITVVVFTFCVGIMDFGSERELPGFISQTFMMHEWIVTRSIQLYHQFPQWNAYLNEGMPLVADPMLHLYNPAITLPVLAFGVKDGFRLGICLSIGLAALGMWWLGWVMGLGRVGRLWMALLFAFAGQPMVRLLSGEYVFIFGYAWIPYSLAGLLMAMQTQRRVYIAVSAVSLAILFFSGAAYYAALILPLVILLAVVMLPRWNGGLWLDWRRWLVLLVIGILAGLLVSIQILPMAEFRSHMSKGWDITGSFTPAQSFLSLTSTDDHRPDAWAQLPAPQEIYAYIGYGPILALLLVPLAFLKAPRHRRMIIWLILVIVFTLLWVDLNEMPWHDWFGEQEVLHQFRIPSRMWIYSELAILSLSALSLDTLWEVLWAAVRKFSLGVSSLRKWGALVGLGLLAAALGAAAYNLYSVNRQFARPGDVVDIDDVILRWLSQYDQSPYYVTTSNNWHEAAFSNGLHYLRSWYHLEFLRLLPSSATSCQVVATPHYLVTGDNPGESPDELQAVRSFDVYTIYDRLQSLPLAFVVSDERLYPPFPDCLLKRQDVVPVEMWISGPNDVEVIARGDVDQSTLVVLMNYYFGWKLYVDGHEQPLRNVSGYLAAVVQPGTHKYTFSFRSQSFMLGLVLSLLGLAATLGMALSEWRFDYRLALENIRRLPASYTRFAQRTFRSPLPRPLLADATYHQGALYPSQPLMLTEETPVHLIVEKGDTPITLEAVFYRWVWASGQLYTALRRNLHLVMWGIAALLGLYSLMYLTGLERFPAAFGADEAITSNLAEELITQDFQDGVGRFLPLYMVDHSGHLWGIGVYGQALMILVFGKSLWAVRLLSALGALIGVVALGVMLRDVFKVRFWWLGSLGLMTAPVWVLFSRQAGSPVLMTSFYAAALCFYALYRKTAVARYLYVSVGCGVVAFYASPALQPLAVLTFVLLIVMDWPYHWMNRAASLRALGMGGVLLCPHGLYYFSEGGGAASLLGLGSLFESGKDLQISGWFQFVSASLRCLSPLYWYWPPFQDGRSYSLLGYSYLFIATLPLVVIGWLLAWRRIRLPEYRLLLLAWGVTPLLAGLRKGDETITYVLPAVIPLMLFAGLGIDWLLHHLKMARWPQKVANIAIVTVFGASGLGMWSEIWQSYPGAGGTYSQADASFPSIEILRWLQQASSEGQIYLSPGIYLLDEQLRFFIVPEKIFNFGSPSRLFYEQLPVQKLALLLVPDEYERIASSPKFSQVRVERIFYDSERQAVAYGIFIEYADNFDKILAVEAEARHRLERATLVIDGTPAQVGYSPLDIGQIERAFDGNLDTIIRTAEANPAVVEITFSIPHQVCGVSVAIRSTTLEITARLHLFDDAEPLKFLELFTASGEHPEAILGFGDCYQVRRMVIEVRDPTQGEPANIHIWEIRLR